MINNVIACKPLQCEGCGRNAELILHHWYNDNTHAETCYKYICESCNKFLETKTTNGLNHVLPKRSHGSKYTLEDEK